MNIVPGSAALFRLALVVAAVVAGASSPALIAVERFPHTVTVRVYQHAALRYEFEQRSKAEAQSVLRAAHVDVRWKTCGHAALRRCDEPLAVTDLVLRVLDDGAPDESAFLGRALVLRPEGGVFATVYSGRVARVASHAQADVALLLGRVVAHELGHLLMNSPDHAPGGLMRAQWTIHEIRRNRTADWTFTAADAAAMHVRSADDDVNRPR